MYTHFLEVVSFIFSQFVRKVSHNQVDLGFLLCRARPSSMNLKESVRSVRPNSIGHLNEYSLVAVSTQNHGGLQGMDTAQMSRSSILRFETPATSIAIEAFRVRAAQLIQ